MRIIAADAFGASFGQSVPVVAADLPFYSKATPPTVYNWTGFYVGGTLGGASGSFDPSTTTAFSPMGYFATSGVLAIGAAGQQSISPTGFTGGFEAGYNRQASNVVFGVEGDIESFRLSGSANSGPVLYPCCAPTLQRALR